MNIQQNRLFCRLDGLTEYHREERRLDVLRYLGLLEGETFPVFDEVVQTAASFLDAPICILTLMLQGEVWIKSAVGLSKLGFMNKLATTRKIPRLECLTTYVVDALQNLYIPDGDNDPLFAENLLVQEYGVKAFLGTPLLAGTDECIGTLAVMDLHPREFNNRDLEFLALSARLCLRELERDCLVKENHPNPTYSNPVVVDSPHESLKKVLLKELSWQMRSHLTSVIGMSDMLKTEVYGHLNHKQKEYTGIIYNSGQDLLFLLEEMNHLQMLDNQFSALELQHRDVKILSQEVINQLSSLAHKKDQKFSLSVEPGSANWPIDIDKVRGAIYYLLLSLLKSTEPGSEIKIHLSSKNNTFNIILSTSHPWLADTTPNMEMYYPVLDQSKVDKREILLKYDLLSKVWETENPTLREERINDYQEVKLGILLSCYLTEIHGGRILLEWLEGSGYRYLITLPSRS